MSSPHYPSTSDLVANTLLVKICCIVIGVQRAIQTALYHSNKFELYISNHVEIFAAISTKNRTLERASKQQSVICKRLLVLVVYKAHGGIARRNSVYTIGQQMSDSMLCVAHISSVIIASIHNLHFLTSDE